MARYDSMRDRILANVMPDTNGAGCWEWTGRVTNSYGRINIRKGSKHVTLWAHRASYEAFVGPIPDELTLDHLCTSKTCVRPDHLEPVTNVENIQRQWRRRWSRESTTEECPDIPD